MTSTATSPPPPATTTAHVDVLIVGAGLSGIGTACHLQRGRPGTSYAILEARGASGGTWDLFRYPGIRSDSDLHTLGYAFQPWTGEKAIADGDSILAYIRTTAAQHGVDRHIRYDHRVLSASWSSEEARWTVEVEHAGARMQYTCGWLFCAGGYYRYDRGHEPDFPGAERFEGPIVHPQAWPQDLDYADKRVVVIGSGATAVTLVPAMTEQAAHVTMLQRSPTYVIAVPEKDAIANALRRVLPAQRAYDVTRRKNIWQQRAVYSLSRRYPKLVRRVLRSLQKRQLPADYAIDTHFNPTYDPWDQRLCAVPDGDLFRAIRHGKAEIVTDHIDTMTEHGIRLRSGVELPADVIVSATGLSLIPLGGLELTVDGTPVALPETIVYRGMMLDDVPNFAFAVGYTNASWTLKVDLVGEYLCRLLAREEETGCDIVVAVNRDPTIAVRPLLDFGAGYVRRSADRFPHQGDRAPWQLNMSYAADVKTLRHGTLDDGVLQFRRSGDVRTGPPAARPTALVG